MAPPTPPELGQVQRAVRTLDEAGALTAAREDAVLTVIGHLSTGCQLDVRGVCCQCSCMLRKCRTELDQHTTVLHVVRLELLRVIEARAQVGVEEVIFVRVVAVDVRRVRSPPLVGWPCAGRSCP